MSFALVAASAHPLLTKPCIVTSGAAVISIGAATLADIYDPHERGTMMGIYYWYVALIPTFILSYI
jgi:hypothetical protein